MVRIAGRLALHGTRAQHAKAVSIEYLARAGVFVFVPCTTYLFFRYVFVSVHEDMRAARSLPRPERPGGRSFGMRPGLELPRPSGAAGRVV